MFRNFNEIVSLGKIIEFECWRRIITHELVIVDYINYTYCRWENDVKIAHLKIMKMHRFIVKVQQN
jgi:hypothetical protein